MKFWILAACCATAFAAARPEPGVTRSIPAQDISRIAAAGDLTVRGRKVNTIRYTVRGGARMEVREGRILFPDADSVVVELPRGLRVLALVSAAGSIDAADLDGSLTAVAPGGKVTLDRVGGDVEAQSGGPASLGTIGGKVKCFSRGGSIRAIRVRGEASFETGGGDIQLEDLMGAVQAVTAAGGIRIEQARGPVYARTMGGPIAVLKAFAAVTASSEGGPIDIGGAHSVRCESVSGTIRLHGVSGSVWATAGKGNIALEVARGRGLTDSVLTTEAGDITVILPSDTGVRLEAETSGTRDERSIVSAFGGLHVVSRRSSVMGRGDFNGGGPLLRLIGAGGRIEIRKK